MVCGCVGCRGGCRHSSCLTCIVYTIRCCSSLRTPTPACCRRDRASVRQFLEGKASVYALIAKDQLMSFQDVGCSACSARERAEVEASARSQREAAEARAAAGGGGSAEKRRRRGGGAGAGSGASSSALGTEDGDWGAVAAASSLVDAQMDGQWRAVSVCLCLLFCSVLLFCFAPPRCELECAFGLPNGCSPACWR